MDYLYLDSIRGLFEGDVGIVKGGLADAAGGGVDDFLARVGGQFLKDEKGLGLLRFSKPPSFLPC
ncbi:MAG: hypothetical protein ACPG32_02770 [Akkermansiaceae bacterium]